MMSAYRFSGFNWETVVVGEIFKFDRYEHVQILYNLSHHLSYSKEIVSIL